MNYEKAYKEALERAKIWQEHLYEVGDKDYADELNYIFPELKEDENELEWLKQFIQEEAYILSMDIRDDEDSFRLKKLQKSLEWLEKQGEKKPIEWKDSDEKYLFWALLSIQKDIAASEISGVNTKNLNDCVKWLYSLKQRIGG